MRMRKRTGNDYLLINMKILEIMSEKNMISFS